MKSKLIKTLRSKDGQWLGELWETERRENTNFIFRQGFTLLPCHLTTGEPWARLMSKTDGVEESGSPERLLEIFETE